jgi:hypothetical protein
MSNIDDNTIYQYWNKENIETVQGSITAGEWSELISRLNNGSFYDELSFIANDFIKEELQLIREDNK